MEIKLNLPIRAIEELVNGLVSALEKKEEELLDERAEGFATYMYFLKKGPEAIIDFVEFVYANHPDCARSAVASFHDDQIDLSKIPCTGNDFKPWPEGC